MMTRRVVDDFGDRLVFDEDDLRWKELLNWESLKSYLHMKGEEFSFVRELIINNQYTSNFQRLVDQILSRLKALEKIKGNKPVDTVFEVCAGFCLVLAILQQATQRLSAAELIKFLSLKIQPEVIFSLTLVADDRSTAMERLFVATTHLLTTVDDSLVDVQYFAANLTILLIHMSDFHGVDFFWRALQLHALSGMQQALANPTNASAFSSCVAVRIVRNLLYFAVNAREEHLQSSAQSNSAKKFRMEPCRGVVLPRIVDFLTNRPSHTLMANGGGPGNSPLQAAGNLLGAIQHIFYDLVARIPVKGLQDFILTSTSQFKTLQERLTGALPAAFRGGDITTTASSSSTRQRFKSYFPQECFAQLLLLLLHHRHSMAFNPFRQSFSYLADLELDAAGAGGGDDQDIEMLNMRGMPTSLAVNYVHVNLRLIVNVMTDMLPNPTFVLLLYSFLQMHPTFIETLRHMDVAKTIFVQLLRGVYQACTLATPGASHPPASTAATAAASDGSSPSTGDDTTAADGADTSMNHLYTLTVCLLILIQDTLLFSRFAHETVQMPWYKERSSSSMKLLDAVIVVMLRTMSFAVFRVQDSYLLSNLCAIFMNVLPSCRELHPYASERLVRTIFSFARRIVRTRQHERMVYNQQQQQQQYPHGSGATTTNTSTVATAVLSSSTPRFIQRGAHKWQVSHGGSSDASDAFGGPPHHQHSEGHAAQLRLPSLASASLDYSYHNHPHPTAASSSTTMGDTASSASSFSSSAMRRRPSITSLSGMDHLEADVMLLQVALMTLTQFTVVLIKACIAENVYFLYALVSDFASLQRYFPASSSSSSSSSSATVAAGYDITPPGGSPEDILQDEIETDATILANHEDTAEWRVLYEDMTAVTALTEYYLMKFDQRSAAKAEDPRASEQYFTAKEAANYLKGEVLRHHQASSVLHHDGSSSSAHDVEGGGSNDDDNDDGDDRQRYQLLQYRLHRGYIPSLTAQASVFNEYYRSQYCYQEAENAAEFFVPYIWSCVVNVLQGSTAAP